MINDKEVGELWGHRDQHFRMTGCTSCSALIRKLVEERSNNYCPDMPTCYMCSAHILEALSDFGIDPASYYEVEK